MSTSQHETSTSADADAAAPPAVLDREIRTAAETDVPVLITAEPPAGLELAYEISYRSRPRTGAVIVVDCRHVGAVERIIPAIADNCSTDARRRMLLLLEVHALDAEGQAVLEDAVAAALLRRRSAFRVIASSSTSVFERVVSGLFRERLYYLLNMIHIVGPLPAGRRECEAPEHRWR